jgi:hypothetical protein
MANREKGEVSLTSGETTYTLAMTFNGMIAAEDASEAIFGRRLTWQELATGVEKQGLRELRLLIWALTRRHHPEMSIEDVGEKIIGSFSGIGGLRHVIDRVFDTSAPDPEDTKELPVNGTGRPRKALRAGTGVTSISSVGGSV